MRKVVARRLNSFAKDEKGATMTEYAIVVGLIAIVAITAVTAFQGSLTAAFTNLSTQTNGGGTGNAGGFVGNSKPGG